MVAETSGGKPIPVVKVDEITWRVSHGGQPFKLRYRVYRGSYSGIGGAFLDDEFGTRNGTRWKVPAGSRGGGLAWLGDDRKAYEGAYQLKVDADQQDAAWRRLIELCRVLKETPDAELERELPKVLDVEGALWFLALDVALLDGDGYASRASDFVL